MMPIFTLLFSGLESILAQLSFILSYPRHESTSLFDQVTCLQIRHPSTKTQNLVCGLPDGRAIV